MNSSNPVYPPNVFKGSKFSTDTVTECLTTDCVDCTGSYSQGKTEMISKNNIRNHNAYGSGRSDRSDRSVGCNASNEDSSSIRTANSMAGRFACFYCSELHSSDQERSIHIDNTHPRKLHYPTPEDFENRLRPNK